MTHGYNVPVREHCALTEQVYCKEITDPEAKARIEEYLATVPRVDGASRSGVNPNPPRSRFAK